MTNNEFVFSDYLNRKRYLLLLFLFVLNFSAFSKLPLIDSLRVFTPPPKIIRTCCVFGSDLSILHLPFIKKTDTISISRIKEHSFLGNKPEGNGIVYTRKGGFIDLAHLRDCADWTAYLSCLIDYVQKKKTTVVVPLGIEGGEKRLILNIPKDFSQQQKNKLAAKIAYEISLWHEISTWFGASYVPLMPERYSSFSPEDLYSNLLGTTLSVKAINSNLPYEKAMTIYLQQTLDSLQAVKTGSETFNAMKKVQEIWWSNNSTLPSRNILIKRYFDTKYSLKPWLIPEDSENTEAAIIPKVTQSFQYIYLFEIKLNFHFPIKSLKTADTITQNDFGTLLAYIKTELSK